MLIRVHLRLNCPPRPQATPATIAVLQCLHHFRDSGRASAKRNPLRYRYIRGGTGMPERCSGPIYTTAFGRRSFIQVGVLGGIGLSLADYFRASAGAVRSVNRHRAAPGRPRQERHPDHSARRPGAPGILGPQARSAHRISRTARRGQDQDPRRRLQREPVAHRADRRQDHGGALHHRPHPRSRAGHLPDVHRLPADAGDSASLDRRGGLARIRPEEQSAAVRRRAERAGRRRAPAISAPSTARSNWARIPARRISRCATSRCPRA